MVQDDGVLRQESVNAWSNGLGPVAQLKVLVNSATHEDRRFTYDDAGHIAQEGVYVGNALSHTNSYVYDVLGRLTNATQGGGSHQYSYDWAGNPLTKYYNGNPTTHTYNAANRMLTVNGVTEFAYDANGNMTQSGAQALTWDVRGQLRSVGGSTFNYDAFGRRTVKTEPTILGGTTTKNYNWTGWSQTNGTQAPVVGSGLDSPIRLVRGSDNSVRVPVQDSHGNITKVINGGSGATLFEAHYSPFGERAITNGSISSGDGSGQPFGFTGAEHDSVSELVYLRNRYYAPGLGRFISEDPIGFAGGNNFYAYCGNDPINFSDPLGLSPGDGFMTGVAGLADGSVAAASGIVDPNAWIGMLQPGMPKLVPDAYNPGAMLRKWYRDYSNPTYGSYRCMEGYGVSAGLAEFGAGVIFSEVGGRAASAIAPRLPKLGGGGCFVAGTMVTLGNGEHVPIESVRTGDTLQARNVETGKTEARVVKNTSKVKANVLITIEIADAKTGKVVETITGTPNHPFFVGEKEGWVPMGELGIGTHLVTRAGPELVVKSSTIEKHLNGVYVYNFIVEGFHTYFAGTAKKGILVHNGVEDCSELELVGNLRPTHPASKNRTYDRLIKELPTIGFKETLKYVLHDGKKYLVDGHTRLAAAKRLGLTKVPVEEVQLPYKGYKTVDDLEYNSYYGY